MAKTTKATKTKAIKFETEIVEGHFGDDESMVFSYNVSLREKQPAGDTVFLNINHVENTDEASDVLAKTYATIKAGEDATNLLIDTYTREQNTIAADIMRKNKHITTVQSSTTIGDNTLEITHLRDGTITTYLEQSPSEEFGEITGSWEDLVKQNFEDIEKSDEEK